LLYLVRIESPPPAREREAEQKNFLYNSDLHVPPKNSSKKEKKFFLRGSRRFVAASGGLPKVRNF